MVQRNGQTTEQVTPRFSRAEYAFRALAIGAAAFALTRFSNPFVQLTVAQETAGTRAAPGAAEHVTPVLL